LRVVTFLLEDLIVMKQIFYFVMYGMVFYLIDKFFPSAFGTLVSWADATYAYGEGLYQQTLDWLRGNGAI
jgi:thiol:disulfide interchange protein